MAAQPAYSAVMKAILVIAVTAALAGCGVEPATTAATAGSIKKQELQEGQKTMQRAQQKIDGAVQQMQQRGGSSEQ
jgi:curli biogenesis system outer membrane secretion channel CsgG